METMALQRPSFLNFRIKNHCKFQRISARWAIFGEMKGSMNSKPLRKKNREEIIPEIKEISSVPQLKTSDLRFDRLQQHDHDFPQLEFGKFVAREAAVDEEYWTAAWLRAETHWENQRNYRYADNYKRKFAEQEFTALKRRCKAQFGQKCTCILTVKKEEKNVKLTVLKSVVGTLDLSIQQFMPGESFPGDRVKAPVFRSTDRREALSKYGYIANLCVSKSARRQGIATNMLHFAVQTAISNGAENVFVHVHRNNKPAQDLYHKLGFEVVEMASHRLSADQTYLLSFRA